jgi:hypothetical protein
LHLVKEMGKNYFQNLGYKPVNQYLSPRKKVEIKQHEISEPDLVRKVKDWVNKVVEL